MATLIPFDAFSCVSFEIDAAIESQLSERQRQLKVIEDKTCPLFLNDLCNQPHCQLRHSKGVDGEVCKHWVRGLCKKGDDCEYLHQYDMGRMPECQFFSKTGECAKGDDCPFLHLDQGSRITVCPWYKRGFCRNGPNCKNAHQRLELCPRYFTGFCSSGPDCPLMHPKFDLMVNEDAQVQAEALEAQRRGHGPMDPSQAGRRVVICHRCQQVGHFANVCPRGKNFQQRNQQGGGAGHTGGAGDGQARPNTFNQQPRDNNRAQLPHQQYQARQRDRNYSAPSNTNYLAPSSGNRNR